MRRTKKTFYIIYILAFVINMAYALPLYSQSSFLKQFSDTRYVGLYITIATLITLFAILVFPQFINAFSNFKTMLGVLLIYIVNVFFLVQSQHPLTVLLFFSVYHVTITLLGINLDVFLEDISVMKKTGVIRTQYLTVANTAILISPILMGKIVGTDERYALPYLVSAALLAGTVLILMLFRKNLNDNVQYQRRHLLEIFQVMKQNTNLLRVFILSLLLRFFYAVMVIYTPLYLHNTLGFSWSSIGIIFTVMLLPFVLLEIPAGYIADKILGEKELIVVGLLIMAIFTSAMAFITSTSIVVWAVILFFTRVGAALLESMHEVYFFKAIKKEDADLINLFRDTHPAGWIAASVMAVGILTFYPFQYLFLALSVIIIATLQPALSLKDTK